MAIDVKQIMIEGLEERLEIAKTELARQGPLALQLEQFAADLEKELWEAREKIAKMDRVIDRLQIRNSQLNDRLDYLEEENTELLNEVEDDIIERLTDCMQGSFYIKDKESLQ